MEIKIGTSGYSFDDWQPSFYPVGLPKGKRLDFYQTHFPVVEINSTYYRIPHPAVMANMTKKTKPDFEFIIKANQGLTHRRQEAQLTTPGFLEAVKPIADQGQLHGILAQFPWSFGYSAANLDYLSACCDLMVPHSLYVEFRHDSWFRRETYQMMRRRGIGFVSVDAPHLPGLPPSELIATTDTAYVRLHGRNDRKWWAGGSLRYDYLYNRDELREWKSKIQDLRGDLKKVYIFFNNCHLGQAVQNAREMTEFIDL